MSYSNMSGFGQEDLSCPPGEEWDWTAMACVTAGQATTPMPSVPTTPVAVPQLPSLIPAPPPPAPAPAPAKADLTPWLIGGGLAFGALLLVVGLSGRSATANKRRRGRRRPPKQWMKDCQSGVAAGARRRGRKVRSTGAVCGAQWYGMSPAKQKAAKRRHYGK